VPRSRTKSRGQGPTAIIIGLLIMLMIGAIGVLVASGGGGGGGGGGEDEDEAARSKRTSSETTRATTTTSTTTRPPINHSVGRGDTLTALARFYGVSTSAIVAANEGLDPDHLVEGQMLVIPSPPPVELVLKPRKVVVGGSLRLKLTGAKEFEIVTFEIDRPTGPFTGPAHSASADGVVTATYELGLADPPGSYTVIARGDQGTNVQTTFLVEADRR
jgi:LysM repeat protein